MGFRIGGVAQPHGNVRACILFGIGWRWQQFAQVKIGVGSQMNHFLSDGFFSGQNRWNRALYGVFQQVPQFFWWAIEEVADAFAGAVDADSYADVIKAFDLVEHHNRTVFTRWALAGATGADVTVYAGQLRMWVHFGIGFNVFTWQRFQQR